MGRRSDKTGMETPPDAAQLMRIVEELAAANHRLLNREHELKRRQFFQEQYNRSVTELISTSDLEATLERVLKLLCEAADADIGVVFLLSPEDRKLVPFASHNLSGPLPPFELGAGLVGSVAREKKRLVSGDIPANFPFKIRKTKNLEIQPKVILAQPLLHADQVMGVLLFGGMDNFSSDGLELVERVSVQIALAIVNAIALQRAVDLARELKFKSEALKRRYVDLEKAHRAKSAFLAGVSHELKTPLHAIIGFARVLRRKSHGPLTPRQEEYLRLILTNGEHLLGLINDILDLSRIESGTMEITLRDVNITSILDECVRSLGALAEKKSLRIQQRRGSAIPAVRADRNKVKQVVFNLLSNAIKFSPSGAVIRLETALGEYGDEIRISVSDEGPGIPPEDRERIFEPFIRLDTAGAPDGTGLGLSIARKLVELHHGRIWVESLPGKGSTFSFTLPVAGFEPGARGKDIIRVRESLYE
jgi:signal transduction histidine kinase